VSDAEIPLVEDAGDTLLELADTVNARVLGDAAQTVDREDAIPPGVMQAVHQAGFFDLLSAAGSPEEYIQLSTVLVNRIARASASMAMVVASGHSAAIPLAVAADQPGRRCPPAGDRRQALVDGGDGVVAAPEAGGGWSLQGGVDIGIGVVGCDALVVITRDPGNGPVVVCVDPADALLESARRTGLRGSGTASVRFAGIRVAPEAVLGRAEAADAARRHAVLTVAAVACGVAAAAVDQAGRYVSQRRQFGRPLATFAGLRAMVAAMVAQADAAWSLTKAAARQRHGGEHEAAMFATEAALGVCLDALQLHGGYGYTVEYPVERLVRDALSLRARVGGARAHAKCIVDAVLPLQAGDHGIGRRRERRIK
jgi:alkylation response protein AidB-like acyl-CoA dehydrogenase